MGKYKLLVIMMIAAVLLGSCATKTPPAVPTATATQAASAPQATSSGLLPAQVDLPGCTVVSPFPTPGPTQESLYPSQKDTDWSKGPDNAKVTIIEYSDFQ